MKITSRPGPETVPQESTAAELDAAGEEAAFKDRLSRMLADTSAAPPSLDYLQAAFAGPALDGTKLSDLDDASAAELLEARQSALGQTVADAREAGEPVPPAVEELLNLLPSGPDAKVAAAEPPSDGFERGTTEEELQDMKDLLAGRAEE